MYNVNINSGGHDWQKQNLVTVFKGKKHFDVLKCSMCGIEGKTTSLNTISVKGSYSSDKVNMCPGKPKKELGRLIEIVRCGAFGPLFSNLTPGSKHIVIKAPQGQKDDSLGVWVMGMGEPVKVLNDEFFELD